MNFNLLDDGWIPVIYMNGSFDWVGISDALENAHEIRQIAATNPMDRVAILRLLLVILYWCRGNPPKRSKHHNEGPFPNRWFDPLEGHRDVFNLFGPGKRFNQYGGLKKEKKLLSANSLIHEIPTGTNIAHFHHTQDGKDGLCPACCATGLVRLPLFSTQGGAGKSPGLNQRPPIYIIPTGASLKETLLLSWMEQGHLGAPIWMKEKFNIPARGSISFLEGLTALPRRVWLQDPTEEGRCILCSTETELVRECNFEGTPKRTASHRWVDPHVVYYDDTKTIRSISAENIVAPQKLITDRPWTRMLQRLIEYRSLSVDGINLFITGFASDQTKYIDVWERTLSIPEGMDRDEIVAAIERWSIAALRFPWRIRHLERGKYSDAERSLLYTIRPHIEDMTSKSLTNVLEWDDRDWQNAADYYSVFMRSIARALAPGYDLASVRRREYIERTKPDLTPESVKRQRVNKKEVNDGNSGE